MVKTPFHRLEFDTTPHALECHLPPSGVALDAGGGRRTIALARRGYFVVLLDLTLNLAHRERTRAEVL